MLTGMSSESMDECSYLFPSLDQQIAKKSKYYIIYITACFSQHYVLISNQYLGAEKKSPTKSQFARMVLIYYCDLQLHVVQVVRYAKLLGESGLKGSRFQQFGTT